MRTTLWIIAVTYIVLYLYFAFKSGAFKKAVVSSSVVGLLLIIALHTVGKYLNFQIPLNIYTLSFSALAGLPGVVLVSLMDFIMI